MSEISQVDHGAEHFAPVPVVEWPAGLVAEVVAVLLT